MGEHDENMNSHSEAIQRNIKICSDVTHISSQLDDLLNTEPSGLHSSAKSGISLLDLKNQILLSYLHNLVNLLIIRISQTFNKEKFEEEEVNDDYDREKNNSSDQVVEQLVWLRLVFEKIKPMESRLKYQIDKLLKTVEELNQHSFSNPDAEVDHIVNDPLSFRPNPAALEPPDGGNDDCDEYTNKDFTGQEVEDKPSKGVYRPPRVAPVIYPEPNSKSKRMAPAPVALREYVSLSTNAPLPESTTGLSNTAVKSTNRAKALEKMKEYEESNMTRLFSNKKESRRRKNDEAAIALGIQTSSSNKNIKRKLGALEGEFDGVLNDINRSSDRYSLHLNSASKSSSHKKSVHHDHLNSSDLFQNQSSNGKRFKKKGAFDKALKKLPK